jgi:hypothetical protein
MRMLRFFLSAILWHAVMVTGSFAQTARLELTSLRTQYENAVDRTTAPVRDKYLAGLRKLRETYTKAGDLESALMVDGELKLEMAKVGAANSKLPDTAEELKTYLANFGWIRLSNKNWIYHFDADNRFLSAQDTTYKATYKVTGRRTLTIYWSSPNQGMPCVVSEDCKAIGELQGWRTVWTRGPK